MEPYESAAALLAPSLRMAALRLSPEIRRRAEEFRLRLGYPLTVHIAGREIPAAETAVGEGEILKCMELCSGGSAYAVEDELREGFLSAPGGHRLGICGRAVLRGGEIAGFREISSLALRIARAVPGAAAEILPEVLREGRVRSTLILAPPGRGKTTLLRDLIRGISASGIRVAVADARGEIAGSFRGVAAFDLGSCTDVMCAAPKGEAILRLLRCMSPAVIAVDEITTPEDLAAVRQAAFTGTAILATAHAFAPEDLSRRPLYRELAAAGVFERRIFIDACRRPVFFGGEGEE
ncbi:MAG: stage III sporulation protein AB [Clostridia bacterium]|nr:stage III sporulation protein AB [Clostridia bacterium]